MAAPKSVSAADLVPRSELKVTVLSPYESDGTGLHGQVGLRLDEIPAAPTAVGVAVGVAPRHATDLSPCLLKNWLLFCLSFAAIFLFTVIFPDLATIPVWLRLLCRLINCCLCCAAILYFWTASRCAADPLWLRLLYKFNIVELFFAHFNSAAKLITEVILEPEAACAVLLGYLVALNLIFCCLRDRKDWLPTSCLKAESTAAETKAPVVTVAVRH